MYRTLRGVFQGASGAPAVGVGRERAPQSRSPSEQPFSTSRVHAATGLHGVAVASRAALYTKEVGRAPPPAFNPNVAPARPHLGPTDLARRAPPSSPDAGTVRRAPGSIGART